MPIPAARRQLAVYGLWAMSKGKPMESIRVQAYHLQESEPWTPLALGTHDIASAIMSIEEHDAFERSATATVADKHGEIVRYEVQRDEMPARPEIRKCGWCPYRSICGENASYPRPKSR